MNAIPSTAETACASPTPGLDGVMPPVKPCNDNFSILVDPWGVHSEAWMWVGIIGAAVVLVLIALVIMISVLHGPWRGQVLRTLLRLGERGSDGAGGTAGK